jgi:hypothetical protein
MDGTIQIAELLSNVSKPFPIVGLPLESLFGSVKVILEMVQVRESILLGGYNCQ